MKNTTIVRRWISVTGWLFGQLERCCVYGLVNYTLFLSFHKCVMEFIYVE